MIDLRQPSFTGTPQEQLKQMSDYLFQLKEQLQYAFDTLDHDVVTATERATMAAQQGSSVTTKTEFGAPQTEEEKLATFNSIKALIIKSGEIVDAYNEQISKKLAEGGFVVDSEYGTYKENTIATLEVNSKAITAQHQSIEEIVSTYGQDENDSYAKIIKGNGYIKAGNLSTEYSPNEYGIEIGYQQEIVNSDTQELEKTDKSVGRFTSKEVALFDQNGNKSAWLDTNTLHGNNLQVGSKFDLGGFRDTSEGNSVVTRWVGGNSSNDYKRRR